MQQNQNRCRMLKKERKCESCARKINRRCWENAGMDIWKRPEFFSMETKKMQRVADHGSECADSLKIISLKRKLEIQITT